MHRNKQRGYELERETVVFWQEQGAQVERVFASGAHKHRPGLEEFDGDIKLDRYTVEAKRKKSGFKFLLDSLDQDNADMLVIRQDGRRDGPGRRLYVLEEATLLDLMQRAGLASSPICKTSDG